ncbi:hypothetical protein [Nannocystis exedens]|nr:hypothetical protein [Nannocystis exedens]
MNRSSAIILAFSLAAPAACDRAPGPDDVDAAEDDTPVQQADEPADDEPAELLRDGEERLGPGVDLFAEADVAGTRLRFLSYADPGAEEPWQFMIESRAPGAIGLESEPAFADASMLDIFLAVTPADVAVPDELRAQEDHRLGERGWFLDRVTRGEYLSPRSFCTTSIFQTALRTYSPGIDEEEIDEEERWKLNFSPAGGNTDWSGPTEPLNGSWCTNCSDIWYHHNRLDDEWELYNVDSAKMAFAACNIGYRPPLCNGSDECFEGIGPSADFWARAENNGPLAYLFGVDIDVPQYHAIVLPGNAQTEKNRDFRIRITHAVDADSFHLGYVWEHQGW